MRVLKGTVNSLGEPLIPITLYLNKRPIRKKAVVDTGFNGSLSIPEKLAREGKWHFFGFEEYEIATGDIVQQKIYLGQIKLDRNPFIVYAVTSHSNDILIGTRLLRNKELLIDFKKRSVQIK